ncbi:MAG: phosphomannomutase/phosphoglucomutase [Patescibacteria group bacterium]|nr:phosphomannomutase/phosphoglucomutase [Patescibacteria group bacterium]
MSQINPTIFREYDIRGRVDKDLNEETVKIIGQGFGTFLDQKNIREVVVGYDAREYSERLKNFFVSGLVSTGVNITDVGMTLTPILYFAQYHLKIKGVAMVTASHNPNGWSGFKLGYGFSTTLLPEGIEELRQIIERGDFIQRVGQIKKYEKINEDYKNYVLKKIKIKRPLKVVVDAGNGTAGPIVPPILKEAGCEVIEQYCDLDFSFPHHEPNPTLVASLEALARKVREVKADLGMAFDGDGDRLGCVDENGEPVWPDQILILLSRLVLKKRPGAKIVFDVKSTRALAEDIKAHGGVPVMWKVGHSYIKQKAQEVDAALAGERSGHIFFREDYYSYDDAIYAALKLLEYLSEEKKKISELVAPARRYVNSPNWHVDCPDEIKYQIIEKLTKDFEEEFGKEKLITINGVRVEFDDGWGLVRASSNLPVLVLGFEATNEKRMREIEEIFRKKLERYPQIGKKWRSG